MKILIISPGKGHDETVAAGIAEYQKRLGPKLQLEWLFPTAGTKEAEGAAILKTIKESDHVMLLDERGKAVSSPGLAELLGRELGAGTKRLVFIIGGAFGVGDEVRGRADSTYSLSQLTFPHMLARLILVEQLYRAQTILEGGKYHH